MIKKNKHMSYGAGILGLIVCLLFFAIIFRFLSLQITKEVNGYSLQEILDTKYVSSTTIEANRGTIYDRNGEVIAQDINTYKIIAILSPIYTGSAKKPMHVVDAEKTARELSSYLDLTYEEIYERLTKVNSDTNQLPFQVEFGKAGSNLPSETKNAIEKLELPGIQFIKDTKRYYPSGIFASHTIGYVDKVNEEDSNSTKLVGMLGLEASLNDLLQGTNGSYSYKKDGWGYILNDEKTEVTPAKDGAEVYLTIDKKIQTFLEDALSSVQEEYEPQKMVAIVASAKTGEILAMSQRPTFNLNTRDGISDTWYNEIIEIPFEPGSSFKMFTLAAAIEEGVFDPNELVKSGTYYDPSSKNTIRDWNNGQGWGMITYLEGVQRSSNVAFTYLAKDKLGYQKLHEYLLKFRFDQPTGIELPKETSGTILYNYEIEKITTAFGQGTTTTPLQQVQAATAIANNGEMLQLHVIDKIVDPTTNEVIEDKEKEVIGKPISSSTAQEVLEILETVITSEKGTGRNYYSIDGYRISGKTGTAQIPSKNGGYLTGKENYIFSFLGFAPADDPELIIYVAVQQPKLTATQSGAEPVSKIFKTVVKSSLSYLNIKPDSENVQTVFTLEDYTNKNVESTVQKLEAANLNPIVIGNGTKIIGQLPAEGSKTIINEKVMLLTDQQLTMPDISGWSLRDVIRLSELTQMQLNHLGNGFVIKQNFSPGSIITSNDYLIVELGTPGESNIQTDDSNSPTEDTSIEDTKDEDFVYD